jgi:hypothetical protein
MPRCMVFFRQIQIPNAFNCPAVIQEDARSAER